MVIHNVTNVNKAIPIEKIFWEGTEIMKLRDALLLLFFLHSVIFYGKISPMIFYFSLKNS